MEDPTPPVTRRRFLRRSLAGLAAVAGATAGYGFWEASQIRILRSEVGVPRLPRAFAGLTVAVLADMHHGPFVGRPFLDEAVRLANGLKPDVVALPGDFANKGKDSDAELPPCAAAMAKLSAPLGVFAVPGNHDMYRAGQVYRDAIRATPITDLTNRSVRLTVGGESLWLAGVDDLWWGKPDQRTALRDVPEGAAVVLLSHNPDYAEDAPDARVSLMLSGHTHGGQVCLPAVGSPWIPSKYGDKYRHGLVRGPASLVFISRGLGESNVPVRLNAPPEINLLTLVPADAAYT